MSRIVTNFGRAAVCDLTMSVLLPISQFHGV